MNFDIPDDVMRLVEEVDMRATKPHQSGGNDDFKVGVKLL